MSNRALLIAFHFPPQAASSGIQRTLSFSKNLGQHGWEPMVLSANPRAYNVHNPSQLANVPPNLVVRRAFALDAKRHMGVNGRYPGMLALPDRWVSWWFAAVPTGLSLVRKFKPEVIWSTFPIATSHLIGLTLHRLTGLPWVADFRDPMLQDAYPTARAQRKIYQWIEYQTITRCSAAVFTTHSAMNAYRARFPQLAPEKFSVIENGYDEDGFSSSSTVAKEKFTNRLTLVHSGVLYQTGRDPSPFFEALASLKARAQIDCNSLKVILRAPGENDAITSLIERYQVADVVEVAPAIPYKLALEEMLAADGLIVFQGTPFNSQIPAKIYEYFRARKPILGLVDTQGETARMLGAAGFDSIVDMDSASAISPVLEKFIGQIRDGSAYIASNELVASSSRTHRASQLASIFDMAKARAKQPAGIN